MNGLWELDKLTVLNLVDNETDGLSAACACCASGADSGVTYIQETRTALTRDQVLDLNRICCAAHGLSLLLIAERDGERRVCLFDAGPTPGTWKDNVEKLALEVADIDEVVLSHFHIDHSGGLRSAVPAICEARAAAGRTPPHVDLYGPGVVRRGLQLPTGEVFPMKPDNPTAEELAGYGADVTQGREEHVLLDCFYVSGEIPRKTSYETGLSGHVTDRNGVWVVDADIMDERYLACKVRGCGLVVFSACSHAGIVNVCRDAVARSGGEPLLSVIGGFHLAGSAVEGRIEESVRDLVALAPKTLFPGHCTGWKAKYALARAFPGRFQPCVVGGTYTFEAPEECPRDGGHVDDPTVDPEQRAAPSGS